MCADSLCCLRGGAFAESVVDKRNSPYPLKGPKLDHNLWNSFNRSPMSCTNKLILQWFPMLNSLQMLCFSCAWINRNHCNRRVVSMLTLVRALWNCQQARSNPVLTGRSIQEIWKMPPIEFIALLTTVNLVNCCVALRSRTRSSALEVAFPGGRFRSVTTATRHYSDFSGGLCSEMFTDHAGQFVVAVNKAS